MPKTKKPWRELIDEAGGGIEMDPDTGELKFNYGEEPAKDKKKTEPKPEAKKDEGGKSEKSAKPKVPWEARYKDVQSWATRVNQENLDLKARMAKLERKVSGGEDKSRATTPPLGGKQDLPTDLEAILSSGETLKRFVVQVITTQLPAVGEYIDKRLEPFQEVRDAFDTHKELVAVTKAHEDFPLWREEMEKVLAEAGDDEPVSFEELYARARALNPDKAQQIDNGEWKPRGEDKEEPSEPDSDGQDTEDPDADKDKPGDEGDDELTSEELEALADRTKTETGVGTGAEPAKEHTDLRATLEDAWSEVTTRK